MIFNCPLSIFNLERVGCKFCTINFVCYYSHFLYAIGVIVVQLKQILKNLYNNLQFIYVYFSINLYADLKKECVQHILFKKVKIIYKIAIKGKYKGT